VSAAVEVRGLHYTYPSGTEALRGVDLDIMEGEYVAIIGPNGSGKSTLALHLTALLKPSKGYVKIFGIDTRSLEPADLAGKVGYLFQNPSHQLFCPTVREELEYGPRNMGLPEGEVRERVERAASLLGLETLLDVNPLLLSRGEKERVALASVLAMDPRIIVLNEPTSGLDRISSEYILGIVDGLNAAGRTIVLITHNMRLVAEHAKRVLVMSDGRVVLDGAPAEVFSRGEVLRQVYIKPPQVYELSRRLSDVGLRPSLNVGEFVENLVGLVGGRK